MLQTSPASVGPARLTSVVAVEAASEFDPLERYLFTQPPHGTLSVHQADYLFEPTRQLSLDAVMEFGGDGMGGA